MRPSEIITSGASRASHRPAPQRASDGAPVHYGRHRPEQTTLYRLVQKDAATFFEQAEASANADLPQRVKDEFNAFRARS